MDLLKLAEMKIIRHERLYLINKGRCDEVKVAASGIDEACQVFQKYKGMPIFSVEEIEDNMFAI